MDNTSYIRIIAFSAPMFSALVCSALCFMYYAQITNTLQRRIARLMGFTLLMAFLCWVGSVLYVSNYKYFVYFNTFFFLALMMDQVLLYKFVYTLTNTGNRRRFRCIHYIIPAVLVFLVIVSSATIPYEVRYWLVAEKELIAPGYPIMSFFFSTSSFIFCIYNVTYSILAIRRVNEYRRVINNYSADIQKSSVNWIYLFIILILLSIPIPLITIFVHNYKILASPLTIVGALLPLAQYVVVCYNLISGNYVLIEPMSKEAAALSLKESTIKQRKFEKYIREKKPYLDPRLKITDMCTDLGTNRSYLSAFINQEYGMNFSRYINRLRLEELERLRTDPAQKGVKAMELIQHAGFNSYRSYLRTKKMEDEASIIELS